MNSWLTSQPKAAQSQHEDVSLRLLDVEKKNGDIKRRSKQAVLHLTFTELRITQMEQQIRKLKAELHNKPDDFQPGVMRRQVPVYKSSIKRSLHGEFLMSPQSLENTSHEQASLEVLVTEHGTAATLDSGHNTISHSTSTSQQTHQQTPERLRIRYAPLIKTLEKVCRETLTNHNFWPSPVNELVMAGFRNNGAATNILRPWKLFVAYEKEIRDSVHNIDAFVEPARREGVSGGVAEIGVIKDCEYDPHCGLSCTVWPEEFRLITSPDTLLRFQTSSDAQIYSGK